MSSWEMLPETFRLGEFLFVLIFGLLIGSFLNVVIVRLPHGKSLVHPGSSCPRCASPIRWFDNIPVASWLLLLRGRCRSCRMPISVRYPVVELITAFLFVACWLRFGWGLGLWLRDWPLVAALVAVSFIDLDLRIIPDEISLGGAVWGLLTSFLDPRLGFSGAMLGALTGFGIFYGFAWLYWFMTRRSGLGGGDIKLLAMLGAFIGVQGVLVTILVSSVLGSFFGVLSAVWERRSRRAGGAANAGSAEIDGETPMGDESRDSVLKTAIPYGPFLVLGAIFYHLLGEAPWFPFTTLI